MMHTRRATTLVLVMLATTSASRAQPDDIDILYKIERGDRIGYVDEHGAVVLEPEHNSGPDVITSASGVSTGRNWDCFLLSASGERLTEVADVYIDSIEVDNRIMFVVSGKVGYLDTNGDVAIPAEFDWGLPFHAGVAQVGVAAPLERLRARFIDDGIKVEKHFINLHGNKVELTEDERVKWFSTSRAVWGEPNCGTHTPPLSPAEADNGRWGFMDDEGAFVIQPKYVAVAPFCGPLAKAQLKPEGRTWYINAAGDEVVLFSPRTID
jgi:hypothetical protein